MVPLLRTDRIGHSRMSSLSITQDMLEYQIIGSMTHT
jgi:hypothetical protein